MARKNEVLTEEIKRKINLSKQIKLASKYDWNIVKSYLDVIIIKESVKKYLTLREFKTKIENKLSIADIIKEGFSKHLLQFFSNFCQGKIKLTKEKFEERYFQGISLEGIAKEFSIKGGDITYLRRIYNIKIKGSKYIRRKRTEIPLTLRQKEILYGAMMGDAKRQYSRRNSSAGFGQSEKQYDYLMWKHNEFKNIISEKVLKRYVFLDKRSGNTNTSWRFHTKANSDVEECINNFYGKNGKQINRNILDNLSELSLAVWYMDDGFTDWRYKTREYGGNPTPEVKICTDSYSKESCDNIVEWFKERWNIDSHLRERGIRSDGGMSYRVVLKYTSAYFFLDLIRPHIIPSMLYKVDYEEYKKKKGICVPW